MNESIDWPPGRECTEEPFDVSWESAHTSLNDDTDDFQATDVVTDPHVLAHSRSVDWPRVREGVAHNPLLKIYDVVRETGLPNMLGSRIPVPSQLNYKAWAAAATGHDDDAYVLDGVEMAFLSTMRAPPSVGPIGMLTLLLSSIRSTCVNM